MLVEFCKKKDFCEQATVMFWNKPLHNQFSNLKCVVIYYETDWGWIILCLAKNNKEKSLFLLSLYLK